MNIFFYRSFSALTFMKVFFCGLGATLVMDFLNKVGALLGWVYRMDLNFLGCVFNGWINGVYEFKTPAELLASGGTKLQGMVGHYLIGVFFAILLFIVSRIFLLNKREVAAAALVLGLSAAVFSLIIIFPSTGLGIYGWKGGMGLFGTSLYNHLAYGFGLAIFFHFTHLVDVNKS